MDQGFTYEQMKAMFDVALAAEHANGDGRQAGGLDLIDWSEVHDERADVVAGLVIAGRWTALVAAAKAGKSTLLICMSVEVAEGRDPWTGEPVDAAPVVYIDAEMGRSDLEERLDECGYDPLALKHWHACELPPRLDTPEGGARVLATVTEHHARMVVIDGLNGTVTGAEKDDTPWRDLYEHTMRPLKAAGVAIVTADNLGKDVTLGPRGSSVKLDKADAIVRVTRTDNGVHLEATHRRTAAYHSMFDLEVVGLDTTADTRYRLPHGRVWPDGTGRVVDLLDELGIDVESGRPTVRQILRQAGDEERFKVRNNVLTAAIAYRRQRLETLSRTPNPDSSGTGTGHHAGQVGAMASDLGGQVPGTGGDSPGESEGPGGGVSRRDTPGPRLGSAAPSGLFDIDPGPEPEDKP